MDEKRTNRRKYAAYTASLLVAGSLVLSSAFVPAFAARTASSAQSLSKSFLGTFTPAGIDSRLAAKYDQRGSAAARFPFTPAGISQKNGRTMTVAARTGSQLGANAVSVRDSIARMEPGRGTAVSVHPSDYRLTAVRGWQGFAVAAVPKTLAPAPLSDLAGRGTFKLEDDKAKGKPSRFNTDVKLDQNRSAAPPARGTDSGDYSVNVGGSFSITRRVDVTAGVRYKSERDRVDAQPDNRADSEAVYVGTKIRF